MVDDPISIEALQNVIQEWLSESTGVQAIWRNQSKTQPELPYASLLILTGPLPTAPQYEKRTTTDLTRDAGSEVGVEMCVPCTFTISCQTYGKDAYKNLVRAQSALELPSQYGLFRAADIAVINKEAVTDITALFGAEYEERANMDITVGAALSITEYNGYIKTAQFVSTNLGIDVKVGDLS